MGITCWRNKKGAICHRTFCTNHTSIHIIVLPLSYKAWWVAWWYALKCSCHPFVVCWFGTRKTQVWNGVFPTSCASIQKLLDNWVLEVIFHILLIKMWLGEINSRQKINTLCHFDASGFLICHISLVNGWLLGSEPQWVKVRCSTKLAEYNLQ